MHPGTMIITVTTREHWPARMPLQSLFYQDVQKKLHTLAAADLSHHLRQKQIPLGKSKTSLLLLSTTASTLLSKLIVPNFISSFKELTLTFFELKNIAFCPRIFISASDLKQL